jgi:hypothetical protein
MIRSYTYLLSHELMRVDNETKATTIKAIKHVLDTILNAERTPENTNAIRTLISVTVIEDE